MELPHEGFGSIRHGPVNFTCRWTCRQSEISAFFDETIQFPGQQGEAGLLYQGHFPAAAPTLPRSMSTVIRASSWTGASATTVPQGSTTCE